MSESSSDTGSVAAPRPGEEMGAGGQNEKPWLFDKTTAKEAGRKGGKARAVPDEPMTFAKIKSDIDKLYDELYKAALGLGRYKTLQPEKQLAALKLLLERVEGRPTPKKEDKTDESSDWSIGVREE